MIYREVAALIGRTPMIELRRYASGLRARIVVKLESQNPGGSVKDRIGLAMIEDAEKSGVLKPGATIVECTSGNTGIALAHLAAARGYRLVLTMPEQMSPERIALLRHLGVEVVLTEGALMRNAVLRADEIARATPEAVQLKQFENPANPAAHRATTGPEIWDDTDGMVDIFVAGVGTGGTITGVAEVLKQRKHTVKVVAVEPDQAAVLSGRAPTNHVIQGLGAGFIPKILNRSVIDEVLPVSEAAAFDHARRLARTEGLFAGISSGATLAGAYAIGSRPENKDKLIVSVIYDSVERYVNTPFFSGLFLNADRRRPRNGK